ncbi:MAG: hypothetical protein ACI9YT_003133 [Halobacteriales archaeon]|jgi:hypothetical protein
MEPESPMQTPDDCRLRAVVEFSPPETCPVKREDGDVVEVNVSTAEGETRCELVFADGDSQLETVEGPSSTCEECVWPPIQRFACFFRVLDTVDGNVIVSSHLPDWPAYVALLDELTARTEAVRTIALVELGGEANALNEYRASIQLSTLTAKEWEALELAVAKGYYAEPRRVSLADLAAEFDITRAAVSQRLNRAERKIVTQLLTGE